MRKLVKIYQKQLVSWYIILLVFAFSLSFLSYTFLKLFNNQKRYDALIESKQILISQVQNIYLGMVKINTEKIIEQQIIPVNIVFEINDLNSVLYNISSLYSHKGSFFRLNEAIISPCEKNYNTTLGTDCLYIMTISGERVKYLLD
ncbi:hypothetical protein F1847_07635 [Thermodesulfobacterium sp. TA1]|uniref:hypothetical protein n=1 Tax=Thermodesulfobacterium sp. TA1 TaxID=2234087 RepID=UPI0012325D31|nr:hypothetical protein [Thermodesulfobacterium sp. TA1]QER42616.1 hypothetical protein F1847_07635 [Thermodesulfobacterium sp. TA1]